MFYVYIISMYILCLYKKSLLKEDFGFLQRKSKGVIRKMQIYYWVYAYILSMVRGCLRVENMAHFIIIKTVHRWTAITVGVFRYRFAIIPLSPRYYRSIYLTVYFFLPTSYFIIIYLKIYL